MDAMSAEADVKIKSIKKTIDVLNCFAEKQPLGVTEISEKLGTYKSNVHRILSSLTVLDYLEQDKDTGKYYLGPGVLKLTRAVSERFAFRDVAMKYARQLADEVGEIVRLTVPMRNEVYYLDVVCPTSSRYYTGNLRAPTDPMHCTSGGKAMMAYMPEVFLEEYFAGEVEAFTEYTITDIDVMRQELLKIRSLGYAVDDMENTIGVSCVGVPIISSDNTVVGALSISGASQGLNEERVQNLSRCLKKYARKIEETI